MFPKPLFGREYFAPQIFPVGTAGTPVSANLFPKEFFENPLFPVQLFPGLFFTPVFSSISRYIDIIASLEIYLESVLPVTTTIIEQPYPLLSGPFAFVVPGVQRLMEPQTVGGGRYFTGVEGNFTIRIIDQSYRDIAYSNLSKLTDLTYGILRTAHAAMQSVNFKIPIDPNGAPIVEEPFVITSIESRKEYQGGSAWAVNEFNVRARYQINFNPLVLPDNTLARPVATNLADLLLGFRTLINNTNIIPSQNVNLSLYEEPFPIGGQFFCTINPDPSQYFDPDVYGAANFYTTMDSYINTNFIVRNVLDIAGRADSLLLNRNLSLGIIAFMAGVINGIQLAFPVDANGSPLTEEPIWIEEIGPPRRYAEAGSYATIPTKWRARWQANMPSPI